jgi:hypothetical protein
VQEGEGGEGENPPEGSPQGGEGDQNDQKPTQ